MSLFSIPIGKRCTRLSKSDIRVQIVHSDHNATRGNDDEEDVKEPMVGLFCSPSLQVKHLYEVRERNITTIITQCSGFLLFLF